MGNTVFPATDDWTAWPLMSSPVLPHELVEVRLRSGEVYTRPAKDFRWSVAHQADDVVAWRRSSPPAETG